MKKVIELRQYTDGGPNDKGRVIGYMKNDESYFRPATSKDTTFSDEVVTDEFIKQYEKKTGKNWNGFVSARKIDKETYLERKEQLQKKLSMYRI